MSKYVEQRGEDYVLTGSRVTLASVVMAWREGLSPESIREDFPSLSLEQVYGGIAYYLANQGAVDSCLTALAEDFEQRREEQEALRPELVAKLRSAHERARR